MKIIKRKSAVKPITGSIVDSTNIADKTTNTYSAEIIDTIISEKTKITRLTDISEIVTANTGFKILDSDICKDRKRYYGNITVSKSSGLFNSTADTAVLFSKPILNHKNTGCFLTTDQWRAEAVGYCYMNSAGIQVMDTSATSKYNKAKITFDILTE